MADTLSDRLRKLADRIVYDLFRDERELLAEAAAELDRREAQPDNGNIFTFCDYVYVRGGNEPNMACVRGAGHNGPHAVSYKPTPLHPIMLLDH